MTGEIFYGVLTLPVGMVRWRAQDARSAPLRMLAQEAHRRLAAELGEERVGLVTGEERVNEHAPIICCTAEMAPRSGEVLVLDEVQWAEDEERGSAWTRLMLGGEFRHILLLGAVEALPLVQHAFPDAEIKFFERKAPLEWIGGRSIEGLRPGSVVVAFSRKAVLAAGYALAGVTALLLCTGTHSLWLLALIFVLAGLYVGTEEALEDSLSAELVPKEQHGMAFGTLAAVNAVGDFLSSLLVGFLWSAFNVQTAFATSALLFIIGAILILRLR